MKVKQHHGKTLVLFVLAVCLLLQAIIIQIRAGGAAQDHSLGGLASTISITQDVSTSGAIIAQEATTESTTTMATRTESILKATPEMVSFGSVQSEEEAFENYEKSGQLTLQNRQDVVGLMGEMTLFENDESDNDEESFEEDAVSTLENNSAEESMEMFETNEESTSGTATIMGAEIEEAPSNAHESSVLDEMLDSSDVSTLSTKSEQQLKHNRFLIRSKQHSRRSKYDCNPLCLVRRRFIASVRKVSSLRKTLLILRKKRTEVNKVFYPYQQLVIKAKKVLAESKDDDKRAEAQHEKATTEKIVDRLQRKKTRINKSLKQLEIALKKAKLQKRRLYLRLKKALSKKVARLLKEYKQALARKVRSERVYKAQKAKAGKTKFVPPYLVNYAKLGVLIAQKRYTRAIYYLFKRQVFVLNHLLKHRSKLLKVLKHQTARSKLFSLKIVELGKVNTVLDKKLEDAKSEPQKLAIKSQIELNKVKTVQYKKHIATCKILLKKAKTSLLLIVKKLKEAASVLSSQKIRIPKSLTKLLKERYTKKNAEVEKKREFNEKATNKDQLNAALPVVVDYSERSYIRLPVKKNNKPYYCTIDPNPNKLAKLQGESISKDIIFQPLVCYHQTKIRVKVNYSIGKNMIFITKIHNAWIRENTRLTLNKKGRLVIVPSERKILKKAATPSVKRMRVFDDRVKYIQTHSSTARDVLKSFIMKYYTLPNETFSLSFSVKRGSKPAIKKSPVQKKKVAQTTVSQQK